MTAPDFSLRQHVRVVLATPDRSVDPKVIAAEVASSLPTEHLRTALEQALPNFVRLLLTNGQRPTLAQWDAFIDAMPPSTLPPSTLPQRPAMTVFADGAWKTLSDCSETDLQDMAARRIRLAEGNIAWATRFATLAEGTSVKAPAPIPAPPSLDGGGRAAMPVLLARRDYFLTHLRNSSSPEVDELQRRRDALTELYAARLADIEQTAKIDAVLDEREASHGSR